MPDQLFTYYTENSFVIIFINSGNWVAMVIWLEIEIWLIGKGGAKRGDSKEEGVVGGGRNIGAAGFCGLSVCLSVFPLL
jgi:hypothetical protein